MEPDDLLCSRNARPPKALVGRAQARIDQVTLREQAKKQSAHEGHCAVTQKLTRLTYREMVEGARFENPEGLETIGPDLIPLFPSQSLTDESEAGEAAITHDRTR
jgi:hypothetical protein